MANSIFAGPARYASDGSVIVEYPILIPGGIVATVRHVYRNTTVEGVEGVSDDLAKIEVEF